MLSINQHLKNNPIIELKNFLVQGKLAVMYKTFSLHFGFNLSRRYGCAGFKNTHYPYFIFRETLLCISKLIQ